MLEGDFQNGPKVGVDNRGDSHLLVYDVDNNVAYEFYRASRPSENADGQWHADQESVWDMKTNTFRTLGWTSADAAGLSILRRPGAARRGAAGQPGRAGRHQPRHPLHAAEQHHPQPVPLPGVARRQPRQHQRRRPAADGRAASASRPASTSRSSTRESQVIAQAMKDYGMIVADNGSNFFFSGASYSVDASNNFALTWNDNDIQDTPHGLKSLHFSDFEVVDLTPVVTGLSAHTGPAGTTVTVIGQNFSGAAGRLQVFFGSTPATSGRALEAAQGRILQGRAAFENRTLCGFPKLAANEQIRALIGSSSRPVSVPPSFPASN